MRGRLMIQRLLTGLKRAYPFFLILYPYWYMHSVLLFNTQKRFGNSASDMNLTIRELQFLKHMPFPWSWNYRDNFPNGIQFFRIEHIVDSQFKTYSWLFTRICKAWVSTGNQRSPLSNWAPIISMAVRRKLL